MNTIARRQRQRDLTCYMCARPATGREHVPPKCLFPPEKKFRNALIRVPSCDEHNNKKSADDEFIWYVLALASDTTDSAVARTIDRVKCAVRRTPKLMQHLLSLPVCITRYDQENSPDERLGLKLDMNRFDDAMSKCARALYFEQTKTKFLGLITVRTSFTLYAVSDAHNEQVQGAFENAEKFFSRKPAIGENAEVFSYQWDESEESCMMLLTFYKNLKVLVRLDKRKS